MNTEAPRSEGAGVVSTSFGGSGELIPGSRCPRCSSPMEYNGNYWCSECPWVLPERETDSKEATG